MNVKLPVIVGFGGFNAAGRSSGHQAYRRMILESLAEDERRSTLNSLACLMDLPKGADSEVIEGTLVRRIDRHLFDVQHSPSSLTVTLGGGNAPLSFELAARDLPNPIPANWHVEPSPASKKMQVTVHGPQTVIVNAPSRMAIQAGGQLPSGFNPAVHYRSTHHPRGLQLAVLGASDAVRSMGISWSTVAKAVIPDEVGVYASSVMSQLDSTGFGGMLSARFTGGRATSKQLALGLNTMPADFINAYILGSVGSTGGITGACATFLYNLRQAVEDIRVGRRKVVVVGSSEAPLLPEVMDGYAAMSALATDADLCKLDGVKVPDYRRASRPFGDNCGFTLGESSQYVVLMAHDLALDLGAEIFGAVPGVYVNADGYKKSISAPGPGNYITLGKAVGLAKTLLGERTVQNHSFVQAHGSGTPHNRITESKIFDEIARVFGITSWPVAATKAYVGHSLGPASGDQLVATLGVFKYGIVPGIKTITKAADDVFSKRLSISPEDQKIGPENALVAFLNSKGFGGNNATATVFSPLAVNKFLENTEDKKTLENYRDKLMETHANMADYLSEADRGLLNPIYRFGENLINEEEIILSDSEVKMPGFSRAIPFGSDEGYSGF